MLAAWGRADDMSSLTHATAELAVDKIGVYTAVGEPGTLASKADPFEQYVTLFLPQRASSWQRRRADCTNIDHNILGSTGMRGAWIAARLSRH